MIPRSALHGDQVYVMTSEKRLKRKTVQTAFSQTSFVVIESGLETGEQLVVSNLSPAIEGMLLNSTNDPELRELLIAEAEGKGRVK